MGFLDPELSPEYLRSDVRDANVAFASYQEITELLTELARDPEVPMGQFLRLLTQQRRAFEASQKRAVAIIEHLNNESAIMKERLGLDDDDIC